MALTEVIRTAYLTVAWDIAGKLIIQQIQPRLVLERDGVPDRELELLPIQFIKAPQENDQITATLTEALDAVTAGALLALAEHEATIATLTEERDRLRTVVSAFPETSSGDTASAAEPG